MENKKNIEGPYVTNYSILQQTDESHMTCIWMGGWSVETINIKKYVL